MPYDMIRTPAKTAALVHENFIDKTKLTKYTGIAHAAVMIEKIRSITQIEANKTKNRAIPIPIAFEISIMRSLKFYRFLNNQINPWQIASHIKLDQS